MNQTKNDKKVLVAYVSDLSVGVGKRVKVGEEEIALFIQNKGDVHAIQNRCPHKGGPLSEGIVSGEYVFCPLHDWKINMEDGLVQAPDKGA
ncbi:nitrite reductase (NAD(P)H) small subunit [Bacillus sp. JCM 19034]|uniref:nitrite reductase (NAD(P)H) small subunit n=1 Tax=Bacillus sp. JCM 19034 TaxID=1481928 RepID=UPI000AC3C271